MNDELFRGQLIDELSEQSPPPLGNLVADSLADGVRMRRNRLTVQMLSGVAGVAAVAVAAVGLAHGIGGKGATVNAASSGSGGAAPVAATASPTVAPSQGTPTLQAPTQNSWTPGATPTNKPVLNSGGDTLVPNWQPPPSWMTPPSAPVVPKNPVLASGQAMALQLEQLLPGGASVEHFSGFPDDTEHPYSQHQASADLFWQNSTIAIRVSEPGKGFPIGCDKADTEPGYNCADYRLSDGTHVNVFTVPGHSSPGEIKNEKTTQYMIVLRPDGTEVFLMEINGRENGNYGAARADLPLTEQQLYTIASDPHWSTQMETSFVNHANATVQLEDGPF